MVASPPASSTRRPSTSPGRATPPVSALPGINPGVLSSVYVITGPSGVGKGTLIRALRGQIPNLELSTSATTRAPRAGEEPGVDYHFLDPDEFERRVEAGDFLEHATYSGNRYGTLRSEVDARLARDVPVVLEIEVQGARQIRESMPEAVQIFIAPPSPEALRERLHGRGTDHPEVIDSRLGVAVEELAARGEFPHSIVNDDVDRAAAELAEIVRDCER
ncbi:MAG: guanylate kinase [Solirubrobacterales bacterium]|nr:guanylate kinase [Solirubrobacterales bacterium]MCB8970071.1 guanylate kinase [Thermoleophilales bacterium]